MVTMTTTMATGRDSDYSDSSSNDDDFEIVLKQVEQVRSFSLSLSEFVFVRVKWMHITKSTIMFVMYINLKIVTNVMRA